MDFSRINPGKDKLFAVDRQLAEKSGLLLMCRNRDEWEEIPGPLVEYANWREAFAKKDI
jgi:hypothetical protein